MYGGIFISFSLGDVEIRGIGRWRLYSWVIEDLILRILNFIDIENNVSF